MSFQERDRREESETRLRGLLRLLPHWLTRNKTWHEDVGRAIEAGDFDELIGDYVRTYEATRLVAHLEVKSEGVKEVEFWDKAIPFAKENGWMDIAVPDDSHRTRLQQSLGESIKSGSVISFEGSLYLNEEKEPLWKLDADRRRKGESPPGNL